MKSNKVKTASLLTACLVGLLTLTGCVSSQERAMRREQTIQAVAAALTQRRFQIEVTHMHTMRYGMRTLSPGFSLELRGDTLCSNLPYMGQVYYAPVVNRSIGLNFEAPVENFQMGRPKAQLTRMILNTKTDEDYYQYIIDLYDTGEASIRVTGRYRDAVGFDGDMEVPGR